MEAEKPDQDCRGCVRATREAKRFAGGVSATQSVCLACGAVIVVDPPVAPAVPTAAPPVSIPQRYAPDPVPPLPPLESVLTGWRWTPSAEEDIAAMMWSPGANEAGNAALETDDEKAIREERRLVRASQCRRRLAWMATQGERLAGAQWQTEGARYADALRHYYGSRGAVLNARESRAAALAARFTVEGEREALRGRFGTEAELLEIQIGNTIIGAAEAAYNRNEWTSVVAPEQRKAESARAKKWREISERWASAKADEELPKLTARIAARKKSAQT